MFKQADHNSKCSEKFFSIANRFLAKKIHVSQFYILGKKVCEMDCYFGRKLVNKDKEVRNHQDRKKKIVHGNFSFSFLNLI